MAKLFKKFDSTWILSLLAALYLFLEMRERFPDLKHVDAMPWWGGIFMILVFVLLYYTNRSKDWNMPWVAKVIKVVILFPAWAQLTKWLVAIKIAKATAVVIAGAITMSLAAFCFNNKEGK